MRRLILATALLLSACDAYFVGDYRERFPIAVQRETPLLLVSFIPGRAEFTAEESVRLDTFFASYRTQNSGPLKVTAQRRGAVDRLAVQRAAAIESRAIAAGIPKSFIDVGLADPGAVASDAVVAFERYTARAPECGDWTKSTTADWTNTPSSNFGCSTQRYVGLMAADPQDLLRQRVPGTHDTQRMSDQLQKYRTGSPTAAGNQNQTTTGGANGGANGGASSGPMH